MSGITEYTCPFCSNKVTVPVVSISIDRPGTLEIKALGTPEARAWLILECPQCHSVFQIEGEIEGQERRFR